MPRRLLVDLPGEKERDAILRILLRDETLAPDVDIALLARSTDSFSGSDLKRELQSFFKMACGIIEHTVFRSVRVRGTCCGEGYTFCSLARPSHRGNLIR